MFDDTENPALQEMAEQATEQEQEAAPVQEEVVAVEQPAKATAAQSFKELRTQKEQLENELYNAQRYIREMNMQRQQPAPVQEESEIDDDGYVEGKQFKREATKLRAQQEEIKKSLEEIRLRNKYPDIDNVITAKAMQDLERNDPDSYAAINNTQGFYAKALLAYKLIKSSETENTTEDFSYEKSQVQKNAGKPRSVATVQPQRGANPLTKANMYSGELTPELQEQLYKEMNAAIKNRGR